MYSHRTHKHKNDFLKFLLEKINKFPTYSITEKASEWIERKMIISEGNYPGAYSFKLTPYLKEIADNLSIRSNTIETAVIKANQLGFSVISFGVVAYYIDYGIGPQLFVTGDADMAGETFEKRLDPILESAGLREKIKPMVEKKGMSRTTGDTKDVKSYAGTFLRAVGANSESKLRSFPSRVNIIEEIDVFPQNLKKTGNPIEKAIRRADSFGVLRRIYYNSTPKQKSSSQILPIVEAGDERKYMWICKICGKQQPFTFDGFGWDTDENGLPDLVIDSDTGNVLKDPVYYRCQNENCGHKYTNADKYDLMAEENGARWVPTKKPTRPNIRTYHIPAFYSPFRSWLDIFLQYWRVKDDPLLYPDFVNDVLAECSDSYVKIPDAHYLLSRRENWKTSDEIPDGVYFTTLSVDVQGNRLEASLQGWGENLENYMLKYWVLSGRTDIVDSECYENLENIIENQYIRTDGVNLGSPAVTFIDAGFNAQTVKEFCSKWRYRKGTINGVYPIVGRDEVIMSKKQYMKNEHSGIATPEIIISDQKYKLLVYHYLDKERPQSAQGYPRGYIHFPADITESYFTQLTSEELIEETDKYGKTRRKIQNPKKRRNEALDLMKMNFAAVYFMCGEYYESINRRLRAAHKTEKQVDMDGFLNIMKLKIENEKEDKK